MPRIIPPLQTPPEVQQLPGQRLKALRLQIGFKQAAAGEDLTVAGAT
jgi:hypothetical protein